jgi:uncharacterized protein (TIGR02217 family)
VTVQVFPLLSGQGFWASKSPKWNTTVKSAASGRQIRGTQQGQPIWQFKVGYEYIRDRSPSQMDLGTLFAFFNNCQGQLNDFYLLDPFDNAVTAQQIATGDGSTTNFQLTRSVGAGSPYPFVEPVYGAVTGLQAFVNGTLQTTQCQLLPLGVLNFASPPAAGAVLTWSGQFYFLCHFTQDVLDPVQMVKGLWSLDGLTFESVIP